MYDANHTEDTLIEFNEKQDDGKENYFLHKERWDSFLKKYIESLPVNKRDAALRVLIHTDVQNDSLENQMIFATHIGGIGERSSLEVSGVIKGKKSFSSNKIYF
jgi:hypothetical protein